MRYQFFCGVFLLIVCNVSFAQKELPGSDLATVSYGLSKQEIAEHSQKAMAGSPDAALSLTNFYWMAGRRNLVKARYWALVGAENGSPEAQFRAWQSLRISKDTLEQRRALYWLQKSALQGYVFAQVDLESCADFSGTASSPSTHCYGPGADH